MLLDEFGGKIRRIRWKFPEDYRDPETAEHAAVADLAPAHLRGSAFGLLALTGLALTSRRPSPAS